MSMGSISYITDFAYNGQISLVPTRPLCTRFTALYSWFQQIDLKKNKGPLFNKKLLPPQKFVLFPNKQILGTVEALSKLNCVIKQGYKTSGQSSLLRTKHNKREILEQCELGLF